MESKTTRLTLLLREFETLMDDAGAPFSSFALPGLTDREIDELLAPTGLTVPTELREWWRWHHGCGESEYGHRIEPGAWGPLNIPQAVEDAGVWERYGASELGWRRSWLPFAEAPGGHQRLVARLEDSTADEVCVGWWHLDGPAPADPVERSLADVVQSWIRAIRSGYATWTDGKYVLHGGPRSDFPVYARN